MPAKQAILEETARYKILRGIELLSRAVKVTLGPKGRHVVIGRPSGAPTVSKDGVTVAMEIELPDPHENMGARLVREVTRVSKPVSDREEIRQVATIAAGKVSHGCNVATGQFEDLVKAGVVDPTKVTRLALQNAASIGGLLLMIECMITESPDASRAFASARGAGMDY